MIVTAVLSIFSAPEKRRNILFSTETHFYGKTMLSIEDDFTSPINPRSESNEPFTKRSIPQKFAPRLILISLFPKWIRWIFEEIPKQSLSTFFEAVLTAQLPSRDRTVSMNLFKKKVVFHSASRFLRCTASRRVAAAAVHHPPTHSLLSSFHRRFPPSRRAGRIEERELVLCRLWQTIGNRPQ